MSDDDRVLGILPRLGWRLSSCRISRATATPTTLMPEIVRRIRGGPKPTRSVLARVFVFFCYLLASNAQTQRASAQFALSDEPAAVAHDPASLMSRDEWKAHVNEIKRRVRNSAAINLLRSRKAIQPTQGELNREATERVLRDYSLVSGDLVMTDRGLLVFRGRTGEEPKEADFEKVSDDAITHRR